MADLRDEHGNPIPLTDEHGNPVQLTDEFGNPIHVTGVATSGTTPLAGERAHKEQTGELPSSGAGDEEKRRKEEQQQGENIERSSSSSSGSVRSTYAYTWNIFGSKHKLGRTNTYIILHY